MHLATGDYILIGPDHFEDIRVSRTRDNELWFLSQGARIEAGQVQRADERGDGDLEEEPEGRLLAGRTRRSRRSPPARRGWWSPTSTCIDDGAPKLLNKTVVYESKDAGCAIEAQDFYDNDTKMTFTCYEPKGLASVMGIDLKTEQVTNFSKAPGTYNEVEGIFPDGQYTCVEADRQVDSSAARADPATSTSGS